MAEKEDMWDLFHNSVERGFCLRVAGFGLLKIFSVGGGISHFYQCAILSTMKFNSFEDMEIWQEARRLVQQIRKICRSTSAKRDFPWVDQITKAAISIMANIAEGSDARTNPEFVNFLGYAKRSAMEVCSHLYYGLDECYLSKEMFDDMSSRSKKIARQTGKLMVYLTNHSSSKLVTRNP